jgi:hypothetical protein
VESFGRCPNDDMSEFKFACPVCGQHITADSSTSGGKLECPTCYRKIVVPQAPASGESKFIVSASEADKPRPPITTPESRPIIPIREGPWPYIAGVGLLLLLGGIAAAGYIFRDRIFKKPAPNVATAPGKAQPRAKAPAAPPHIYAVPTNTAWTLDLEKAVVLDAPAQGRLHGQGFMCEKAILQGGNLTLRQGSQGPADLGITVQFFAQAGEEMSGKTVEITDDRDPPVPAVVLRWKNEDKAATRKFSSGYALKVVFDAAENRHITGTIYLALQDDDKSFVSGKFDAEIGKPPARKNKTPKTPKIPKQG